jgi:hypothetical protein
LFAAASGLASLPLLEALSSKRALAQGMSDPRRLVLIHLPNGTVTRANNLTWFSAPNGPLTTANAPIPLQPFASNLEDVTILKFLTQSARDRTLLDGSGGHGGAKPCFFTGQFPADRNSPNSTIAGDSFDVQYGRLTPQNRSIYLANSEQGNGDNVEYAYELSHKDGQRVVPELNPVNFYNQYFKNLMGGVAMPPSDAARNPKMFDVPAAAAARLNAKLGKNDRLRLDAYLQGLTDLRARLGTAPPMSTCAAPPVPAVNMGSTSQSGLKGMRYFERMKAFNDLIAVGFQCDLFRSVAISFGAEGNYTTYDGVYPASLNYNGATLTVQYDHSVSHQNPISGESGGYGFDNNMTRDRVHLMLVLDLVDKLKAVIDPSGSRVLDNTAIMAGFCVDDGQHGSDGGITRGSPVVVCGGKNFMSPGKSIDASTFDLNDLYFTLSTKLGMGLTSFHPIAQSSRPYGPMTGRTSGSSLIPL